MGGKKKNTLARRAARLALVNILGKRLVQKETEKAEALALKGRKQNVLTAGIPSPAMLFYRAVGGRPSKVVVKTYKRGNNKDSVRAVKLVKKRTGLIRRLGGFLLRKA